MLFFGLALCSVLPPLLPASLPGGTSLAADPGIGFLDLRRPLPQIEALDAVLADLNGDGAPELVVADLNASCEVLVNDGDAVFRRLEDPLAPFGGEDYRAAHALAAELDGDGNVDLVLGGNVLLGRGDGTFAPAIELFAGTSVVSITALDYDTDGDLDLLFGRPTNELYRNDGGGSFTLFAPNLGAGPAQDVAVADFDGDGDPDLVLQDGMGELGYYRNDAGVFTEDPARLAPFASVAGIRAGDVDGDGDEDLVLCGQEDFFVFGGQYVMENDGSGALTALRRITFGCASAELSEPVDVDADGDLDLVSLWPLEILRNQGDGTFVEDATGFPAGLRGRLDVVLAEDVDGDGDLDFVAVGRTTPRLLLGDGAGTYYEVGQQIPTEIFTPLAIVDLDEDGDLDVIGQRPSNEIGIRLNDGSGRLTSAHDLLEPVGNTLLANEVAVGDLDGDGLLDLYFVTNRIFVQRAGRFVEESDARLPASVFAGRPDRAVRLLDVDGDGDADVFLGGRTGKTLLVNQGDGVFEMSTEDLGPLGQPWSLDVADVNADGIPDVYVGNLGQDELLLGDGSGGFTYDPNALPFETPRSRTSAVRFGDLDRDGDADAYAARFNDQLSAPAVPMSNALLLNDGTGVFSASPSHVTDDASEELELFDADNDGDLDVLLGQRRYIAGPSFVPGTTTLYVNDGAGALSLAPFPTRDQDLQLATGDLDCDGDEDVVAEDAVLTNLTRALAFDGIPRLRGYALQVFGSPGAPYAIFGSTVPGLLATELGLLKLDLGTLGVVRTGVLGPNGRANEGFDLASTLPAGTTIWFQAVVGWPLALTNPEVVSFVDF